MFRFACFFLQSCVPHGTGSSKGKGKTKGKQHLVFYQNLSYMWDSCIYLLNNAELNIPSYRLALIFIKFTSDPTASLLFPVQCVLNTSALLVWSTHIIPQSADHLCPQEFHVHSLFLVVPIKNPLHPFFEKGCLLLKN